MIQDLAMEQTIKLVDEIEDDLSIFLEGNDDQKIKDIKRHAIKQIKQKLCGIRNTIGVLEEIFDEIEEEK